MKYMGSKSRLAKDIVPIINNLIKNNDITTYIEPFVGGANVIEHIWCDEKIGYDNNEYLIELLSYVSKNGMKDLPRLITREHYSDVRSSFNNKDGRYEKYYIGYIGFVASYNGRFFDGGYSGHEVMEKGKEIPRDFIRQTIQNLESQIGSIDDVTFIYSDFNDLKDLNNTLIYCDPPYKDTKQYMTSKDFPYEKFYDWCREMSKNNIVLISEYNMPDDFECIWEKSLKTNMMDTQNGIRKDKVERIFMLKR